MRKDKIGFATPEYNWLNEMKNELKDYISNDLQGFINVGKLLRDWDSLVSNQPREGFTVIWRFINLAIWKKGYSL